MQGETLEDTRYQMTVTTIHHPELGELMTYGIVATEGKRHERIDDISENKEAIEKLVEVCNREKVALVHFRAVVEDFIRQ